MKMNALDAFALLKTRFEFECFKQIYIWDPKTRAPILKSSGESSNVFPIEKAAQALMMGIWTVVQTEKPKSKVTDHPYSRLVSLSRASNTDVKFCLFKLQEELGEVAKAYNQPERADEPLEAELVDLLIVAHDALLKVAAAKGFNQDFINQLFHKKLDKWEAILNSKSLMF